MTRAHAPAVAALLVAAGLMLPGAAAAQRGVARTGALPRLETAPPAPAPHAPMRGVTGMTPLPRLESGLRGSWDGGRFGIGRTEATPYQLPRPMIVRRSGLRDGCLGPACGCSGAVRCGRSTFFAWATGLPVYIPFAVPFEIPYVVPVSSYYVPAYAARPEPPPVPPAPGHSKMIVVGGGNPMGAGGVTVEQVNDSLLRLTWVSGAQAVHDVRLFLADSSQQTLRSQPVDPATPSVLFVTRAFRGRIAYAGVSGVMAYGTILTTLVPYQPPPGITPTPRR
jgi:hypothetical protein